MKIRTILTILLLFAMAYGCYIQNEIIHVIDREKTTATVNVSKGTVHDLGEIVQKREIEVKNKL